MIKSKTTVDIIYEIQNKLNSANLPYKVKVDIGQAMEGADIGINVYIEGKRNWKLHEQINNIIQDVLEKENLIAYIEWHYEQENL
ncbi:MAG: hypothetical protein GXO21_04155 [Aquificae bacterium]|nr:hypothetical protein [Aquificota bacterium]